MIIVQLTGGLGNQMFQYAMGRTLSIKNNTTLKLDISFFEDYEWHKYSLLPFNIIEDFATEDDLTELKRLDSGLLNRFKKKIFGLSTIYHTEESLCYDAQNKKTRSPAYLKGYWQSENYFSEYSGIIRNEFTVKPPPSPENQALLNNILQTLSVSLHIRRGNYVNVAAVNSTHGVCSLAYYYQAIAYINTIFQNAIFYIFSDDIQWAKENLDIPNNHVFVDINNDETDFEDMRLLYSCKHHILANSTFSWWGAWLNPDPKKTVIAPQNWFKDPALNQCAKSIIPQSWITL